MIILLAIISIIALVVALMLNEDDLASFFLLCFGVLFIIAIFLGVLVSNG